MLLSRARLPALCAIAVLISLGSAASAEQPFGWINNGHTSAYSLAAGEFELSGKMMKVNDTLDVLDLRADLLRTTARLTDNSGDFDGTVGELRVGVGFGVELFYARQQHDLTLKINMPTTYQVDDLDTALDTTAESWGFKWVLREAVARNRETSWQSLALEASKFDAKSREFGGFITQVTLDANSRVTFDPASKFAMDQLKDDGWMARLIYSSSLTDNTTASGWLGYAEIDSSSGTRWDIDFAAFERAFAQRFDSQEKQLRAGFNLNWQRYPRLPVQLSVEYLHIYERSEQIQSSNSPLLPSFLRGKGAGAESNISANLSVAYWITPNLYAGLSGQLYQNQFTGYMPHFNNPISGNFSDVTYGYAELKVGLRF